MDEEKFSATVQWGYWERYRVYRAGGETVAEYVEDEDHDFIDEGGFDALNGTKYDELIEDGWKEGRDDGELMRETYSRGGTELDTEIVCFYPREEE